MNSSVRDAVVTPMTVHSNKPADGLRYYYLLFFLSGFPALIYQIVWQRALFALYGVDIESVTLIVSIFMLGLGLGSLAGGWLSARAGVNLLRAFGAMELSVGVFGLFSLYIFHAIASFTAGGSRAETGAVAFVLLLVPTLLMGSTLPLLAEHFVRFSGNVGESVGALYSVNTFGSGAACLVAAYFLMRLLGESGSVRVAVCFNAFVGVAALLLERRASVHVVQRANRRDAAARSMTIPFWIGMFLACATGLIALSYEIIWYRLYSFASGTSASCFAKLLGFYLLGIAYGSLVVRDACKKQLNQNVSKTLQVCSEVVVIGAIAAYLVGPALAHSIVHVSYEFTFVFVFFAAALLGSAFPLLANASIDPETGSGKHLGMLYLSNIIGATLGSFVVGFVVLNYWSTRATSVMLLGLGVIVAAALLALAGRGVRKTMAVSGFAVCILLGVFSKPIFAGLYERLLYKETYKSGTSFAAVVENRNGVIAVDQTGTVYGEGVYDGRFDTDLVHDTNGLVRAFVIAGFHPNPKDVLVIGLSSGSWVQVVANDPDVQHMTVVEINPGYLPLIPHYPQVASLLHNPKIHIVIDDGRRWMVAHPNARFDFIMINTTFNWRANASDLLSTNFLELVREHLKPGGIEYYNTTWSKRAMATGIHVFPYALRFAGFMAVSDSPFKLDEQLWKTKLADYKIDGRPVFNFSNPYDREQFNEILHLADHVDVPGAVVETRASLVQRLKGVRLITDDNMGTEWSR
jgi:predicted membrane-bound spermidine synthase